jgi:hypothetical protein
VRRALLALWLVPWLEVADPGLKADAAAPTSSWHGRKVYVGSMNIYSALIYKTMNDVQIATAQ